MGCTIEITGENQERFKVLSNKFGQRAALQTLLEEDGTASIDGFISDVEQGDRVNALTFATIDFLVKSKGDNVNILDLQPSDVTDDKLKAAIGQSRNKLERILEDALSEEELSEENIHIASRTFVALENFDELIPKIVDRFKAYQLDTNELNFELDEIIEFENAAENSKERIYDVESTERNSLDNVKPSVKMFLATLPDMYKDADGNSVERLDDIGMVVPVNFSEVYSIILKNLVDHKNMESMYETLENLAPDIPNIQNVLDHLKDGTLESDVGIQVYGRPVNSFENAFFTSFANTKYDYVTVTTQTDRTGIDPYIRSQALKTNKRDPYRELKNKWAARAASIVSLPANIKARTWNNIVGKKFNPTMGMSRAETARYNRQWKDKLENFGNKSALIEAADALGVIGIDVTVPGLAQLRKKLGVEEFSKFIMDDLHMIADNMMNKNVDIFADEGTTLNKLAMAEASVSFDLGASSFMTNKQKQVHPINLPTFVTELINDFNENGEQFESFMDDPMFSKSRILNDFRIKSGRKVTPHKMELGLFDSLYNNDSKKALDYTELDPVSSLATRMKLFFNYRASRPGSNNAVADPTHGWFMVPTPADRSNTPLFKARTLKFDGPVKVSNIFKEGSEFRDWVLDMAQSEFERVEIVRDEFNREEDKSNLVVNYHTAKDAKGNTILGNGGYFNYFPELNQFLAYNKDGSLSQIDFTSPEVLDVLEQAAKEQVQADLQYMEEIGFIDSMGVTPTGNPRFSNIGPSEATKTMIADNVVNETNTIKFILNSIVINHELSGMFYGDLAFFNSQTNEDGTVTSSFESANKRAGLAYTPGNKLNVGNTAARENFKVAFVEDAGFSSDYLDVYTETLGNKQGKKYGKINITDGQGFVSLERYAEILAGQGLLSSAMRTTINELKKPANEVQWSKVTETIEPIKGFLHSNRYDGNFDRVMAKSLKYSLFPVVPSAIEDNPTMQQIHQKMEDGIDELVFQSGSKMGTYNVNSIESLGADLPLKTVTMSNYDWRMPQVIPYKKSTTENFGSQIRKLMEGNIVDSNDYDGISGKELKEAYQQAISQKLENSFRNLRDSLETDGVTDLDKVVDRILNDLERNVYKSNSDFINKALEVMENEMGGLETRIPMSFPAIKHKMESVLNSIVRKAVTKQDLPGFSGVVYSSLGFNKASINVSRELRPTRMEDGVVMPAEVKMSPQYFANTLVKKAKELSRKKGNGREIAEINTILAQFRNGTFDINRIPQSLRAGVAYRIPTQGKNSIIPITVVGFTPGALTTSIVLPAEVVTQTGMDYDIDKVWIELKHFNYDNSSFNEVLADMSNDKGIDNTIINIHNAILTSPHHFVEMSTPNHSDVLDEMRATFEEIYPNGFGGEKFSSLSTQDHFRDANQAGGIFIGIASNANTAHSVFQQLDVSLSNREEGAPKTIKNPDGSESYIETEGVEINGKVVRSLSLTKNRDGGLISEDHIEIQTAAVDNASNPLLGYLNINTITGSTYLFLVEAGMGLKYPTYLMNTPIIRELTKQARISESTLGSDGAFEAALKKLALERDIDLKSVQNQDFDVTQRVLDEVIKKVRDGNPTQVHDAQILKAFLTFRKYGTDMNRVQSALRTDIIGPKQTLAANVIQVENLSKVLGTYSNVNYNKTYPNDSVEPIETIVINPEKYKNHSIHTYEQRGLWGAIDLVSEFIDDSTPVFKKVLKDFQEGIGGYLAESDIRLLMNDMYAYVLANQTARRDGHHSILASTNADTLSKLLMGENSTAKKVMEAQQEEKRRSMEDVSYMPNRFLMSLSTVMNDSNTGYDLVNFNNTITRALTSDQKTALSNEYYDMITAENAEYLNNLAVELFVYNFSMEGFNRGVNSFSEFIPIELYENYTDGLGGESVVDFYLNSQPDFQDLQSYDTDQFLNLFLRNRGLQLKGLKNLYYRKMSEVKEFLTQNPRVQYFIFNSSGNITLGKRVEGTENQFSGLGGLIGHDNVQVEYHSGNPISEMETPQQVKERLERTGDIEQEEGSNC